MVGPWVNAHMLVMLRCGVAIDTLSNMEVLFEGLPIDTIDDMGGMVAAIERNYPQMEIADAAYTYQKQIDSRDKTVVGVNKYSTEEELPVDILHIDPELERHQIERTNQVKERRDKGAVSESLERLGEAVHGHENLMPFIIDAVNASATEQEICDVFREIFGMYRDPGVY